MSPGGGLLTARLLSSFCPFVLNPVSSGCFRNRLCPHCLLPASAFSLPPYEHQLLTAARGAPCSGPCLSRLPSIRAWSPCFCPGPAGSLRPSVLLLHPAPLSISTQRFCVISRLGLSLLHHLLRLDQIRTALRILHVSFVCVCVCVCVCVRARGYALIAFLLPWTASSLGLRVGLCLLLGWFLAQQTPVWAL